MVPQDIFQAGRHGLAALVDDPHAAEPGPQGRAQVQPQPLLQPGPLPAPCSPERASDTLRSPSAAAATPHAELADDHKRRPAGFCYVAMAELS